MISNVTNSLGQEEMTVILTRPPRKTSWSSVKMKTIFGALLASLEKLMKHKK